MRRCSASSGEKPRSRKTLPVERVIFNFIVGSPSSLPASLQESAETLPREIQVPSRCLLRALPECVKHVDRLIELCEVDDAMLESRAHANLANTETDRRHGLPVVRLKSTLNPPKLKSCHLSRIGREAAQIVSGGPEPDHGLLSHVSLYKYRHVWSTTHTRRSPNQPQIVRRKNRRCACFV